MTVPSSTEVLDIPTGPPWPAWVHPEEIRDGIYYPCSDGEPVGENDWHFEAIATLRLMLQERYRGQDVYIASDLMFYYEQGNPRAVRAPDCMVVFGVSTHKRFSWMTWEEDALPAIVFEFASKRTLGEDLGAKRVIYERLGIPEYVLFDPTDARLGGRRLVGYRLIEGIYREIEPEEDGGLISDQLGVKIYYEAEILRLTDLRTYRPLLTVEETSVLLARMRRYALHQSKLTLAAHLREKRLVKTVKQRIEAERQRAEIERQNAEAERRNAEAERRNAEAERRNAEAERRNAEAKGREAEAERLRADSLAAEVERLRSLLAKPEPGA